MAWNVISFSHLNRSERKRIDAEIQIIKSLDHSRILKFISVWINREKEEVVFVTERVSGGSLRSYICRLDGPLKVKVIKNWCRQILEGVSYLHSQPNPVIHRDLKCDNIFINGNDGKVLIGDLGLSTSLRGAASCATSIVGTPEFMAPELYEEKYGPPVDIYAFGMCLVEMVSRQYPYSECTTPGQIYKKVISNEKPKVLSRIKDPALRHIIEVCLDTDPDNRPTADDLLADPYWNQLDAEGDKLAEITEEEEGEGEDEKGGQGYCLADRQAMEVKKVVKSGVYHEEAEVRKAQAAAAAVAAASAQQAASRPGLTTLPLLAPNVIVGPGDDTLILLSSPKSARRSEEMEKSDVLTYCRRKGIERVEKVHLILELNEGKYHNVIFDFNALTDHPQIISQELRDAGLVWEGVSDDELVRLTAQAIMDRISEVQNSHVNTSTLSSVASAMDLLSSEIVLTPSPSSPRHSPPTEAAPIPQMAKGGKPPLPPPTPSPPSRASMDSTVSGPIIILPKRSSSSLDGDTPHYLFLSRETCAHLTTPLASSLPSGDYPQPRISFESVMPGSSPTPDSVSIAPSMSNASFPARQGSISNSIDEWVSGSMSGGPAAHHYSLSNWPSAVPPANVGRSVNGEDIKQLQAMLAVAVTTGERRHTSFVPGVYCAFAEDTVRDFQLHNGLEITGEVDDKTWELLSEQVAYRKRKEEERAHKREEAHRKAKLEQERKLQQQKEESARAMDNIMEKTLSSIGVAAKPAKPSPVSPTVVAVATALLHPGTATPPDFPTITTSQTADHRH